MTEFDDRARRAASPLTVWLKTRGAWILLLDLALVGLFTALSEGHVFWSEANAQALLLGVSETLLLALGLAMMLGAGTFDLSLGANLVLSSVVGAMVMHRFQSAPGDPTAYAVPWLVILTGFVAAIAAGMLFGLVNGLLVAYGGVNSLIATLGTMGIGTGVALLLSGGADVSALPVVLQAELGLGTVGGVPLPAIAAAAVALVLWAVVRFTRYGLRVRAIGSDRTAAERAGIRSRRYILSLTVLAGALAGLAGFIDLSRFGSTAINGHANDALGAVTAAVIGGTLLEGGHISITGAIWGAALAVILQSGLVVLGVSAFWQLVAVGGVLLAAVLLDRIAMFQRNRPGT
ncbi:ABC transporter permease [Nocardioides sp. NPDC006273]|uniref:ABC transporter permease n=1 Tax=Nocardioides sp. NPDC006273 TaxID=3155598 RepID=UPI0033B83243